MASREIYPPIIDSYMPAFNKDGNCRVYFSLSKFNGSIKPDNLRIHVAVMKQNNGLTVVNPVDEGNIYRSNGKVIINKKFSQVKDSKGENITNLQSFELTPNDINNGQTAGWVYKIQIRLSDIEYNGEGNQTDWLNYNASHFSEQSTVCVTKAIGEIGLILAKPFNYDSTAVNADTGNEDTIETFSISSLIVCGNITSKEDPSEKLYSYRIRLYNKETDELVEDSGELFSNKYQDNNEFYYQLKKEFKDGEQYRFRFDYMTNNGYNGKDSQSSDDKGAYEKEFIVDQAEAATDEVKIITIETAESDKEREYFNSTIYEEQEEGRIGIKILPTDEDIPFSGNLCIRRSSEKDNFETWADIKIIVVNEEYIKNLDIIYDYTIESGVYYKYGIQKIDRDGYRSVLKPISAAVMREFEYSFLLGEGGKQLKLKFDNTMTNYKIQQIESKLEPIGSKYPIITRNAAVEYRIIPINGLISFQMDENHLFCNKKVIYGYDDVVKLHNQDRSSIDKIKGDHNHDKSFEKDSPSQKQEYPIDEISDDATIFLDDPYDYIYERDFRKLVLNFLHDGKPKLFKSPTEGNIIVRLTDINCTPNQSLSRMLYSFTSNGNELAEATMENYLKYGFYEVGEYAEDFSKGEIKLGQLITTFYPDMNVIQEIFNKYTKENENIAGYKRKIQSIFGIRITIEDKPLRIQSASGDYVLGNNIEVTYNNTGTKIITIYNGIYEFDNRLKFTSSSESIYILGSNEEPNVGVNAVIDFFYETTSAPYSDKRILSQGTRKGLGQIYTTYRPGTSIYKDIYYKYFIDTDVEFRKLNKLTSIEIEAEPGAIFEIRDENEITGERHEMNTTGLLNFYNISDIRDLQYIGIRKSDGSINTEKILTIMVNYRYILLQGVYKNE